MKIATQMKKIRKKWKKVFVTSDSKKRLHICYCIQKQMCNRFYESDYIYEVLSHFNDSITLGGPFKKLLNIHFLKCTLFISQQGKIMKIPLWIKNGYCNTHLSPIFC